MARLEDLQPNEESATAWIAANAVDTDWLPADLSDRHDFYLYGTPDPERQ